jgi:hypothetical protein
MALLEINWNPSRRELKQFAGMWIGFFALVGLSCLLKKGPTPAVLFWLVALAGMLEFVLPGFLRPIYVLWMCLALPIGWTISHLLLLSVYYLVLTPIGLTMRLLQRDPLDRRIDRSAKSYWTPHDPGAGASRYFRQF